MLHAVPPAKKVKGEMLLQQAPRYDCFRRFLVLFRNRVRIMFHIFRSGRQTRIKIDMVEERGSRGRRKSATSRPIDSLARTSRRPYVPLIDASAASPLNVKKPDSPNFPDQRPYFHAQIRFAIQFQVGAADYLFRLFICLAKASCPRQTSVRIVE